VPRYVLKLPKILRAILGSTGRIIIKHGRSSLWAASHASRSRTGGPELPTLVPTYLPRYLGR
jgi:hypothetical protein